MSPWVQSSEMGVVMGAQSWKALHTAETYTWSRCSHYIMCVTFKKQGEGCAHTQLNYR